MCDAHVYLDVWCSCVQNIKGSMHKHAHIQCDTIVDVVCISLLFLSLSVYEAMELRAHQRTERRKEIEELKRKKEEEKLVSDCITS